jgi:hypothetical protein
MAKNRNQTDAGSNQARYRCNYSHYYFNICKKIFRRFLRSLRIASLKKATPSRDK